MRVTYNGPFDEVEIPEVAVTVKRGASVEAADAFGARLIEQACFDTSPEELLAWVGKDVERAATLLRAERDGAQRPEVLDALEAVINPPPAPEPAPPAKRKPTSAEQASTTTGKGGE